MEKSLKSMFGDICSKFQPIVNTIQSISNAIADTGWIDITPSKGTWSYFKIRRVGDMVHIRAYASSFAWDGATGDLIAIIPTGYRPPFSNLYSLQTSSARRTTKIGVTTDGNLVCDYSWNADGSAYTSGGWLEINLVYFIGGGAA